MRVQFAPKVISKLKKQDVRIRKNFKQAITTFAKNPRDPRLNNHELHREWSEYRSIDITADWRAIYQETPAGDETVAYFVAIGTHQELYGT